MTVKEAYQSYGSKRYITSEGENLAYIVRIIYNSDDDRYLRILEVLNPRVNWTSIPAGVSIQYLDPSVVNSFLY